MKSAVGSRRLPSLVLVATLVLAGCGDAGPDGGGTLDLAILVAPGVTLDSAGFTITGPDAFSRSGEIDVSNSTRLSAIIGGIPAGTGYTITITATLTGAVATCSGTASFDVVGGMTTHVSIHLLCRETPRTGSVQIDGTLNVCPAIDALSASPAEVTVGSSIALAAAAHDLDTRPLPVTYAWTATSGLVSPPDAQNPTFTCSVAGEVTLTLTVSDGDCTETTTAVVFCSPGTGGPPPEIKVNEVESSGGEPGDWVELYNPGASSVDLSGWVFRDNDDTHTYVIPPGTSIAGGGFLVLEEAALDFGLGAADSARLYAPGGTTIVDTFSWTSHATTTYGRCPDGSGELVTTLSATKGSANACPGGGPSPDAGVPDGGGITTVPWPGANTVAVADAENQFTGNMSGLFYEPAGPSGGAPAELWAVQNGPSKLYRLIASGAIWVPATTDDWAAGKTLRYPDGMGAPDSEGVARAELDSPAIYVSTERDNDNNGVSRLSVLRFDVSAAGSELVATHEWNLTGDLPAVGANLGLEAITWIPDAKLVAAGFIDESAAMTYDPSLYPDHGSGIFFVGVEAGGAVYAYALDHQDGSFQRIATIASGQAGVMDLQYDRELGDLWAHCDNTCGNKDAILRLGAGKFSVAELIERPSTLPDGNHEGIAFAPLAECVNGQRSFFWLDDGNAGGHSLRRDTIPCGPL